jgi:hypothetical protein
MSSDAQLAETSTATHNMANNDSVHTDGGDTVPAPPPLDARLRYIAPIVYILLHLISVGWSIRELGAAFLLPLPFTLGLALLTDHFITTVDCQRTAIDSMSQTLDSNAATFLTAQKRLRAYKAGYEKAIRKRDAAVEDQAAALTGESAALKKAGDALEQNISDYRIGRKAQNELRLGYYRMQMDYQAVLLAELDKLIRKFKGVSVPKVKGVSPKKAHGGTSLTAPIERLAAALRTAQGETEKQVKVAEKIEDILGVESLKVEEMYEKARMAEEALHRVSRRPLQADGVVGSGSAAGGFEVDLSEHYERLDKYFKELAAQIEAKKSGVEGGDVHAVGEAAQVEPVESVD